MEHHASEERKIEEVKKEEEILKACQAIVEVRSEVDMLSKKVNILEASVRIGSKLDVTEFINTTELLMRQLVKLDGIEAEGEVKVQRKNEVKRILAYVDTLDALKATDSNSFVHRDNIVPDSSQRDTFDFGMESLTRTPTEEPETEEFPTLEELKKESDPLMYTTADTATVPPGIDKNKWEEVALMEMGFPRLINKKHLTHYDATDILDVLEFQKWTGLITTPHPIYPREVAWFYAKARFDENSVSSNVHGMEIDFDDKKLGEVLGIPADGFCEYGKGESVSLNGMDPAHITSYCLGSSVAKGDSVFTRALTSFARLLQFLVSGTILQRKKGRLKATCYDQTIIYLMGRKERINLPSLIIQHMYHAITSTKGANHTLPYAMLLTKVFNYFKVPLELSERVLPPIMVWLPKVAVKRTSTVGQIGTKHVGASVGAEHPVNGPGISSTQFDTVIGVMLHIADELRAIQASQVQIATCLEDIRAEARNFNQAQDPSTSTTRDAPSPSQL